MADGNQTMRRKTMLLTDHERRRRYALGCIGKTNVRQGESDQGLLLTLTVLGTVTRKADVDVVGSRKSFRYRIPLNEETKTKKQKLPQLVPSAILGPANGDLD